MTPATPRRSSWVSVGMWAALLGLLAFAVKSGWLAPVDHAVAHWVQGLRTPRLDATARAVTYFGNASWAVGVMVVMSLWWVRRTPALLAVFWGTWGLGFTLQALLRLWVVQWRPETAAVPADPDFMMRFNLAGFTSGHGFRSAFLYGWWAAWFARRQTRWAGWAAWGCLAVILLIGLTRLYLNRHWLSDVLGAWILAIGMLELARRLRHPSSA